MKIDSYLRRMGERLHGIWLNPLVICCIALYLVPCSSIPIFSQQKTVQYGADFEFKEGIYLSVFNFRSNSPISPARIVFSSNRNDKDFLKYVLNKATFVFLDSSGREQRMNTGEAWGYSSNGHVYINHGMDFNRVTVIGSICHFVATIPMKVGMSDPFYSNQPFRDPEQYTYVTEQMVIDLESGKVFPFSVENMEVLLSRDEILYKEFTALKKKQKRDSIFVYLRKYNTKYPVYFPE